MKKKDQEAHLVQRVALVPFIQTKHGAKYLSSSKYNSFKYYGFPEAHLTYADLPTIKNRHGEDIINISAFYTNFKDYLYDTADNAIKRILRDELKGALTQFTLLNHFKPKVYEPFYSHETGTLTILLHCKEPEDFTVDNYSFQTIIGNPFADFDEIMIGKIGSLVDESAKIAELFMDNPLNTPYPEVKKCIANHEDIAGKEKAKFYS